MRLFPTCSEYADLILKQLETNNCILTPNDLWLVEQLVVKYSYKLVMSYVQTESKKKRSVDKTIRAVIKKLENKKDFGEHQVFIREFEFMYDCPKSFTVLLTWYDSVPVSPSDMKSIVMISMACDYECVMFAMQECRKKQLKSVPYLKAICINRQREINEKNSELDKINAKAEIDKSIIIDKPQDRLTDEEADRIKKEVEFWNF